MSPAALAKAKAFGLVAAAITAGGAGGMVALSHVAPSGAGSVTVAADATAPAAGTTTGPADAATTEPSDTSSSEPARPEPTSTAFTAASCPSGVSHGDYVHSVATASPTSASNHGSDVSSPARSDCGKPTHPPHPTGAATRPGHSPSPRHTAAPRHSATPKPSSSSTGDGADTPTDQHSSVSDQPTTDATVGNGDHGGPASGGHDH